LNREVIEIEIRELGKNLGETMMEEEFFLNDAGSTAKLEFTDEEKAELINLRNLRK
jgi:hypothetical protein